MNPAISSAPLRVRAFAPDDEHAVTAIYGEAVRNGTASFEIEPPSLEEMRGRIARLLGGGFPVLVAERADGVAGYAYAGPYRLRPAYRWTVEDTVYVDPAHHGCGLGRALLERLVMESEARGFRQMIAVIGDSANAGSIALHRAAGFRPAGVLEAVGFKHGRWLDSVLMQRGLGTGSTCPP